MNIKAITFGLLAFVPVSGYSQTIDLCAGSLPYQSDPLEVQKFRQQCTIQKLINERADAENKATAQAVETSVMAAHAKAQIDTIGEIRKENEFWKQYAAGDDLKLDEDNKKIEELSQALDAAKKQAARLSSNLISAVDASCSWHGIINAPTAKMCRIWHDK